MKDIKARKANYPDLLYFTRDWRLFAVLSFYKHKYSFSDIPSARDIIEVSNEPECKEYVRGVSTGDFSNYLASALSTSVENVDVQTL